MITVKISFEGTWEQVSKELIDVALSLSGQPVLAESVATALTDSLTSQFEKSGHGKPQAYHE